LERRLPEADWRGVLAVILSEAKDLCAHRARPFAEFILSPFASLRVNSAKGLRVTGLLSKYLGTFNMPGICWQTECEAKCIIKRPFRE
jgi:hypothetical protein